MQRTHLSVVELIGVLFAIAIVGVIIMPLVNREADPGRFQCQENLRLISRAVKMYSGDWDDHLPAAGFHPAPHTQANSSLAYGWADAVTPYLRSQRLFQCPSEGTHSAMPWQAEFTDYYFNKQAAGQSLAVFMFPTTSLLLGEGNDGIEINDARYVHSAVPASWRRDTNSPSYRHAGGCNYVFVDGHIQWLAAPQRIGTVPANGTFYTFGR